jgi:microcystin-dependent protein
MPSPITSADFENQTPGQSLCDAFQDKLLNNGKMRTLLEYLFTEDGNFGADFLKDLMASSAPIGMYRAFPVALPPDKTTPDNGVAYLECNGQQVARDEYPDLFALLGTAFNESSDADATKFRVPNLAGKFMLSRSPDYPVTTSGGEASHRLTPAEGAMNEDHTHIIGRFQANSGGNQNDIYLVTGNIGDTPTSETEVTSRENNGDGSGAVANLSELTGSYVVSLSAREKLSSVDSSDVDDDDDTTERLFSGHNNMPPYLTGVIYIVAGYRVGGEMI